MTFCQGYRNQSKSTKVSSGQHMLGNALDWMGVIFDSMDAAMNADHAPASPRDATSNEITSWLWKHDVGNMMLLKCGQH